MKPNRPAVEYAEGTVKVCSVARWGWQVAPGTDGADKGASGTGVVGDKQSGRKGSWALECSLSPSQSLSMGNDCVKGNPNEVEMSSHSELCDLPRVGCCGRPGCSGGPSRVLTFNTALFKCSSCSPAPVHCGSQVIISPWAGVS